MIILSLSPNEAGLEPNLNTEDIKDRVKECRHTAQLFTLILTFLTGNKPLYIPAGIQ